MVRMHGRKRLPNADLERHLKADARDVRAWEYVTTVPASGSPRPAWYGRPKHLELAAKFYVLSILHRLGTEANLTYAHPDNVDIAAVLKSGQAVTLDVKTLTGTMDWLVEDLRPTKGHFVVFVCYANEWQDPDVVPDVFIWQSERLRSLIARERGKMVSLREFASKHDPSAAWERFTTRPAA